MTALGQKPPAGRAQSTSGIGGGAEAILLGAEHSGFDLRCMGYLSETLWV